MWGEHDRRDCVWEHRHVLAEQVESVGIDHDSIDCADFLGDQELTDEFAAVVVASEAAADHDGIDRFEFVPDDFPGGES